MGALILGVTTAWSEGYRIPSYADNSIESCALDHCRLNRSNRFGRPGFFPGATDGKEQDAQCGRSFYICVTMIVRHRSNRSCKCLYAGESEAIACKAVVVAVACLRQCRLGVHHFEDGNLSRFIAQVGEPEAFGRIRQ